MSEKFVQILKKYDESLDKAHIQQYSLSTQISTGGFSFAIFHNDLNKYLSIEAVEWEKDGDPVEQVKSLSSFINSHEWLNQPYPSALVLLETPLSTLVPEPLFNQDQVKKIANFNFNVPADHILLSDRINAIDARLIYPVSELLMRKILEFQPNHKISSHISSYIELLLTHHKNQHQQKLMFVNIRTGSFDIVISEGRRLLFQNSFLYTSREDVIYYIIFVMEQLGINPEETEILLSGIVDRDSKLYEIMRKYVRHINFLELSDQFSYSYHFSDVPQHYFFNLINSRLCEL